MQFPTFSPRRTTDIYVNNKSKFLERHSSRVRAKNLLHLHPRPSEEVVLSVVNARRWWRYTWPFSWRQSAWPFLLHVEFLPTTCATNKVLTLRKKRCVHLSSSRLSAVAWGSDKSSICPVPKCKNSIQRKETCVSLIGTEFIKFFCSCINIGVLVLPIEMRWKFMRIFAWNLLPSEITRALCNNCSCRTKVH